MPKLDPGQCSICYAQPTQKHGDTCPNNPKNKEKRMDTLKVEMVIKKEHGLEKVYDTSEIILRAPGLPDMTLNEFILGTLEAKSNVEDLKQLAKQMLPEKFPPEKLPEV